MDSVVMLVESKARDLTKCSILCSLDAAYGIVLKVNVCVWVVNVWRNKNKVICWLGFTLYIEHASFILYFSDEGT
jgi:hypothetical protein